jgi:hypothetical protein
VSDFSTGRLTSADASEVRTHADFVVVLEALLADYRDSGEAEWENATLDRFLDGLVALAEAWPQLCANHGEAMPEQPTWRMIAELIVGTTGYE